MIDIHTTLNIVQWMTLMDHLLCVCMYMLCCVYSRPYRHAWSMWLQTVCGVYVSVVAQLGRNEWY